jgi:hypothetical protein
MASQMGTEFTILSVGEYTLGNGVDCWELMRVNERGEKWPHLFPKFTLEQRAAEYDLDPADVTTLLEMVMHEPHIPDPTDYRNFDDDAAGKKGMTIASKRGFGRIRAGARIPIHLHNAPDRATARDAHLARITEAKTRVKFNSGKGKGILSKGDTTDPLQTIIDNHGVDPERVKARAAYVEAILADRQGKPLDTRLVISSPGEVPVVLQSSRPALPYDTAVRRRGLTVALLDLPQE